MSSKCLGLKIFRYLNTDIKTNDNDSDVNKVVVGSETELFNSYKEIMSNFCKLRSISQKHNRLCEYIDIQKFHTDEIIIVSEHYSKSLEEICPTIIFNEKEIATICYELVHALQFLNEYSIIHRNLDLSNILLKDDGHIMLSDYGLFHITRNGDYVAFPVGHPFFMAPELIAHSPGNSSSQILNCKNDVWSIGIIMMILIRRGLPSLFGLSTNELIPSLFNILTHLWMKSSCVSVTMDSTSISINGNEYLDCVCCKDSTKKFRSYVEIQDELQILPLCFKCWLNPNNLESDNEFSSSIIDFVNSCLKIDPSERLTLSELLGHSFLVDNTIFNDKYKWIERTSLDSDRVSLKEFQYQDIVDSVLNSKNDLKEQIKLIKILSTSSKLGYNKSKELVSNKVDVYMNEFNNSGRIAIKFDALHNINNWPTRDLYSLWKILFPTNDDETIRIAMEYIESVYPYMKIKSEETPYGRYSILIKLALCGYLCLDPPIVRIPRLFYKKYQSSQIYEQQSVSNLNDKYNRSIVIVKLNSLEKLIKDRYFTLLEQLEYNTVNDNDMSPNDINIEQENENYNEDAANVDTNSDVKLTIKSDLKSIRNLKGRFNIVSDNLDLLLSYYDLFHHYPASYDQILNLARKQLKTMSSISEHQPFPLVIRHYLWPILLKVDRELLNSYEQFDILEHTSLDNQLDRDLPRCHPYHPLINSSEGQGCLRHIIKALFLRKKNAHYWQGLDSVAAPFVMLFYPNEALAYACLERFTSRYLNQYFKEDSSTEVHSRLEKLSSLLLFYDPNLALHLASIQFAPNLYAVSWFYSIFAHVFPLEHDLLKLWDVLLLQDASFILLMAVAIVESFRDDFLQFDFDDCIHFFSTFSKVDIIYCVNKANNYVANTPRGILNIRPSIINGTDIHPMLHFPTISIVEFIEWPGKKKLIDCRRRRDYRQSHWPTSINIAILESLDELKEKDISETKSLPQSVLKKAGLIDNAPTLVAIIGSSFHHSERMGHVLTKSGICRVCLIDEIWEKFVMIYRNDLISTATSDE